MANTRLADVSTYLRGMNNSKPDKMKVERLIRQYHNSGNLLDVGCADGSIVSAFALRMKHWQLYGVDIQEMFIEEAKLRYSHIENLHFQKIHFHELLQNDLRFDAITWMAVGHEIGSYSQGIPSILNALGHSANLLKPNGLIVVRDMLLPRQLKESDFMLEKILKKILASERSRQFSEFEGHWGKVTNIQQVIHFLLKYRYVENWQSELEENYVIANIEDYTDYFALIGMPVRYLSTYALDFLKGCWRKDFGFTKLEMSQFVTTTLLAAQKV